MERDYRMSIKSKKFFIISSIIVLMAVILVIGIKSYTNKQNALLKRKAFVYNAISYGYDLNIDMGDCYDFNPKDGSFDEDRLYNYKILDENELYVRVAYYNLETGSNMSYEDLIKSYDNFLKGNKDEIKDLEAFHTARVNGKNVEINGKEITEDNFIAYVYGELKKSKGKRLVAATHDEIDDAINTVIVNY